MTNKGLNNRARKILAAVVQEYLKKGTAVGSRTVTRNHNLDLSPATVRNVMADLEDSGYLDQPHTSAGRIPTATGLRFFVDSLIKVRRLPPNERDDIRLTLGNRKELESGAIIERASSVLSEITQHAGIVLAPHPKWQRLQHLEFHPLDNARWLCVLVTSDGHVQNRIIEVDFDVEKEQLERIHNYLDALLKGLTLDETRGKVKREMREVQDKCDQLRESALKLSDKALNDSAQPHVVVAGSSNLLVPDQLDEETLKKTQHLMKTLETKTTLLSLLDKVVSAEGIQVFLGAETELDAMEQSSVIARHYGPDEQPVGAIAVVGPMRMNYAKVISIVDFTATLLSEIMGEGESR